MSDEDAVFKVGDVVSLKRGGHLMTVASIDESSVTCDWSVRGDVKSKSFPSEELKQATEPLTLEQLVLEASKKREEGGGCHMSGGAS
jgi:uncharacterized protein YodC (DUF2158 family)